MLKRMDWVLGKLYTQAVIPVNDHDFSSQAVIPHGLYDIYCRLFWVQVVIPLAEYGGLNQGKSAYACSTLVKV